MNCFYHPARGAQVSCEDCRKFMCAECWSWVQPSGKCIECAVANNRGVRRYTISAMAKSAVAGVVGGLIGLLLRYPKESVPAQVGVIVFLFYCGLAWYWGRYTVQRLTHGRIGFGIAVGGALGGLSGELAAANLGCFLLILGQQLALYVGWFSAPIEIVLAIRRLRQAERTNLSWAETLSKLRPQTVGASAAMTPSRRPAAPGFPAPPPVAAATIGNPPIWSTIPPVAGQPARDARGPAPIAYLPMGSAPPPPPSAPPRAAAMAFSAAPLMAAWPTASPPAWSGVPSRASPPPRDPLGPAPAFHPQMPSAPPLPPSMAPPRPAPSAPSPAPPYGTSTMANSPAWTGTPAAASQPPGNPRAVTPVARPQATSTVPAPPPPPLPLAAAPSVAAAPRRCPRCQFALPVASCFCPQCGTSLQDGIS